MSASVEMNVLHHDSIQVDLAIRLVDRVESLKKEEIQLRVFIEIIFDLKSLKMGFWDAD